MNSAKHCKRISPSATNNSPRSAKLKKTSAQSCHQESSSFEGGGFTREYSPIKTTHAITRKEPIWKEQETIQTWETHSPPNHMQLELSRLLCPQIQRGGIISATLQEFDARNRRAKQHVKALP